MNLYKVKVERHEERVIKLSGWLVPGSLRCITGLFSDYAEYENGIAIRLRNCGNNGRNSYYFERGNIK